MKITSIAPMRADLAGGTLDIYPLHVFMGEAVTVNAALTLTSEVSVSVADGPGVRLISEDLGVEQSAPDVLSLDDNGPLGFIARVVKFYRPKSGVVVRTRNNVPKGSGLGASSTLLIALSHALNALNGTKLSAGQLIDTGCNIEAEFMQVPAGKQDYYSATYGGLSAIYFSHAGNRHEHITRDEDFLRELDRRLVVSFAGEPRFSGASNWNMFKAYVDREGPAREHLDKIRATAYEMMHALARKDVNGFAALLQREWEHRRGIAEGVSTPDIEKMMRAAAGAGAVASKVCGAGGGGCMVTVVEPRERENVRRALAAEGAMLLDCTIAREGVRLYKE